MTTPNTRKPGKKGVSLHGVLDHVELIATFVVCALLLFLKFLHIVSEDWVSTAILLTLMLLTIASIRDRANDKMIKGTLDELLSKSGDPSNLRWYAKRSDSNEDMIRDMQFFPHLAFIGVSQQHLYEYLRDTLHHGDSELPWETLEVYFASDAIGEAYEGMDFRKNVSRSRQEIAGLVTDPQYDGRLKKFRSVRFFQQEGMLYHTGALFGGGADEISVIYAVHSAVRLGADTREGLTMRIAEHPHRNKSGGPIFEHYCAIYHMLMKSSRRLGEFSQSVWDRSAVHWSKYARTSQLEMRSAEIVGELLAAEDSPSSVDDSHSILDVGAGAGDASEKWARERNAVVVLLDGSPQMVRLLRDKYQNDANVRVALNAVNPSSTVEFGWCGPIRSDIGWRE